MQRVNIQEVQPEAYNGMYGVERYIATSSIEKTLQELVRLRASVLNGCTYCIDMHSEAAAKAGESQERIAAIADWQAADLFSDKERAALAATDDITKISDAGLRDETYARLGEHFSDEEIAQLIVLCALINAWNRIAISTAD